MMFDIVHVVVIGRGDIGVVVGPSGVTTVPCLIFVPYIHLMLSGRHNLLMLFTLFVDVRLI